MELLDLLKLCVKDFDEIYEVHDKVIKFQEIEEKDINGSHILEHIAYLTGVIAEEYIWDQYIKMNI